MAAPEYVPVKPMDDVRTYESPPRRPDPWIPRRPGEVHGENPRGESFGDPGPDQGYGLGLARRLGDQLRLTAGEEMDDVIAGCAGVGLKRASLFGRAPVIHDFTAAFTIWGYLDAQPDDSLVALRTAAFDQVAIPAHYGERRRIVAAVREEVLRKSHHAIADHYATGWRGLLDTAVLEHTGHG
jgi:hypothetical protein